MSSNPIANSLFRTYGVPAAYWRKDIGLTTCGAIGQSLIAYIQGGLVPELGSHFHGASQLRPKILPLFCRALLLSQHKAYYLRADQVATKNPEDPPEEFVRKHLDAMYLCIDHLNDHTKRAPAPGEEAVFRFEERVLEWLANDGLLFTAGEFPIDDTGWLRPHVLGSIREAVVDREIV